MLAWSRICHRLTAAQLHLRRARRALFLPGFARILPRVAAEGQVNAALHAFFLSRHRVEVVLLASTRHDKQSPVEARNVHENQFAGRFIGPLRLQTEVAHSA